MQDALHAHALLRRDVDYVVKNGAIEMVDEFKGRIALDRRWPAGLHTAIEAKEGVASETQGRVLGSITLQHLVALYPQVCGMTGTAATQADRVPTRSTACAVEVIPTNRPVIRVDHPDVVFPNQTRKGAGGARRDPPRARHAASPCWWAPRASRNPSGSARMLAGHPAPGLERAQRRARGGHRRAAPANAAPSPSPPTWPAAAPISDWARASPNWADCT